MAPIIRILLRYLTFPLLAIGLILPEEQQAIIADPDMVSYVGTGLGLLAPLVAEAWYTLARRLGAPGVLPDAKGRSRFLFSRNSGRKTAEHFCCNCSRWSK